jgi:hypothetical protein
MFSATAFELAASGSSTVNFCIVALFVTWALAHECGVYGDE